MIDGRNSSHLMVDFVDLSRLRVPGRIGLTIAPGKKDEIWDRDLDTDLGVLRQELHTDVLVSLLEDLELDEMQISELPARARQCGMCCRRFPIQDVCAPGEEQMPEFCDLVDRLTADLRTGKTVVVHCRGGLGRSGLVAACCLVNLGLTPGEAMAATRKARRGAIQALTQEEWIRRYARAIAQPGRPSL